jgi:hypothetical protein
MTLTFGILIFLVSRACARETKKTSFAAMLSRPFRLSRIEADDVDVQSVQHAARLGHAVAANSVPQVTPGARAS